MPCAQRSGATYSREKDLPPGYLAKLQELSVTRPWILTAPPVTYTGGAAEQGAEGTDAVPSPDGGSPECTMPLPCYHHQDGGVRIAS